MKKEKREGDSTSRLGDFWKYISKVTNILSKVAQMFGNFLDFLESIFFDETLLWLFFEQRNLRWKFGYFLVQNLVTLEGENLLKWCKRFKKANLVLTCRRKRKILNRWSAPASRGHWVLQVLYNVVLSHREARQIRDRGSPGLWAGRRMLGDRRKRRFCPTNESRVGMKSKGKII